MEHKIPKYVVDIMKVIHKQNKQSYIIGGATRDMLLGKMPNDYDLCTNLSLEELKKIIPNFHIMKKTEIRNTGIIRKNNLVIEISGLKGKTLEEDILARDFTINAIAMDYNGNIIDPYNYQKDLSERKLSLIDKTGESIKKNPLIILRALRIASQNNLQIDENTKEQIQKNGIILSRIIGQRGLQELSKLLLTEKFPEYLDEYFKVLIMLIPELINIYDLEQTNKLLKIIPSNLALKFAVLFTYNKNSIQDFTQFANRMKLDKKTTKLVKTLLTYKDKEIPISQEGIMSTIHEFNIQNVDLLFAYKKSYLLNEEKDINNLETAKGYYQKTINEIIQTKLTNLQFNQEKIEEMGFSKKEAKMIFMDIRGRIITDSLHNSESSIRAYILNKHKKS